MLDLKVIGAIHIHKEGVDCHRCSMNPRGPMTEKLEYNVEGIIKDKQTCNTKKGLTKTKEKVVSISSKSPESRSIM